MLRICCPNEPFPHEWDQWADSGCAWAHIGRMLDGLPIPDSWWQWMEGCDPSYLGSVIKGMTYE